MNVSPRKVVLALIERDGQFILINRLHPHLKLTWAFPGGKIEGEEVRMDVKEVVYLYCQPLDPKQEPGIGEDYEIKEIKWVSTNEVLNYFTSDVHPTIKTFLESFS